MPFKPVGKDDYTSPSGRHFNGAQVRLYYAHGGHFPGEKERPVAKYAKGGPVSRGDFAQGGAVIHQSNSEFLKQQREQQDQEYSGKGSPAKRTGDKSLAPVKPRK